MTVFNPAEFVMQAGVVATSQYLSIAGLRSKATVELIGYALRPRSSLDLLSVFSIPLLTLRDATNVRPPR